MHDLIGFIYEAAADPARWQDVSAMIGAFYRGAVSGIMLFADPLDAGPVAIAVTGVPEGASADYSAEYHRHDLLSIAAMTSGGALVRSHDVTDMATFERHVFWNEFSRPHTGAWHGMAMGAVGAGNGLMIVCRERGEQGFGAADEADFAILRRHVNRALSLSERFGTRDITLAGFDAMRLPALVMDRSGRLLSANEAALAMLSDHGLLAERGGRALPQLAASGRLAPILRALANGSPDEVARLDGALGQGTILLRFSPLPLPFGAAMPGRREDGVLVTLQDVANAGDDPGVLGRMFDLTAAEAAVAVLLLQGLTAPAIAARRKVSELTIRSQLERIVAKTGARNLRECALRIDRAMRL